MELESGSATASFNREEVVRQSRDDLNFFGALLMPAQFLHNFAPLHIVAWSFFLKALRESEYFQPTPKQKFPQLALGWPRGHLKTTLIKLLACWAIIFTKKKFILITASNLLKAKNIVADICDMLGSQNVRNVWGDWRLGIEKDTEELKKFTFCGKEVVIAAIGAGGDPRGLNIKNERPDLILMDDIQSKEDSESDTLSRKLLSWMNGTLKKAKSQHGCVFIYVGNMFSSKGCILKIIRRNPEWLSMVVPGILADGKALWPELRSKEELLQELKEDIAMGTPEVFFSEIMNDENAGVTSCFDITKVPYCPFSPTETPAASFIVIDVATEKIGADDTTIIYYEVCEGVPVATEMEKGVFSPGDTIRKALLIALKRGCYLVAVESVAYQSSLLFWFRTICEAHGIEGIQFVELFPRGRPKNHRILTMLKSLIGTQEKLEDNPFETAQQTPQGKPTLYLRDHLRPPVFWEISQFKPSSKDNEDNVLDNLAYASDMMQEYQHLMWNPFSIESQAFENAKIVENNCCF